MSSMFTVYQKHADLYDELVNHEDFKSNIKSFLLENIEWKDKIVCEFGVGTGRVTKFYIKDIKRANLYDISGHMIEKAKLNLINWIDKLNYFEIDNRNINTISEQFDIVIEGWSFGHLIVEEDTKKEIWVDKLISESIRIARDNIIFIETMGTNVEYPTVPGADLKYFYSRLNEYGFVENIIETNYLFDNYEEATRIMGGFFCEKMKSEIEKSKKNEIKEYTGVWIFDKKRHRTIAST